MDKPENSHQDSSIEANLHHLAVLCHDAERLARRLSPDFAPSEDFAEGLEDGMTFAVTSHELGGKLSTTVGMSAGRLRGVMDYDGVEFDGTPVVTRYAVETQLKAEVDYLKLPAEVKEQLAKVIEETHLVLDETTVYEVMYTLNYTFADDGTFEPEIGVRYLADGHDIIDDEGETLIGDGIEDDEPEEDANLKFLAELSKAFENEFQEALSKEPIHIIEAEVAQSVNMSRAQHQERCANILQYIKSTQAVTV